MLTETLRDVFHTAVDHGVDGFVPAGTPVGVAKLSYVLRAYNAMMGGGMYFALEALDQGDLERAVDGFRYLDLTEEADLLSDLAGTFGDDDYDEEKQEHLYDLITEGEPIHDAFRRKATAVPADFGL